MAVLADYLRRRREAGETPVPAPRVTPRRVALAVAVAAVGAAAVRQLRRRREPPSDGESEGRQHTQPKE